MTFRERTYRQLAVPAWQGPGCSPTNRLVMWLILINLGLQGLETEPTLRDAYGAWFDTVDWVFVGIFTVEYLTRVWVVGENPRYSGLLGRLRYIVSPFALIDLVAILPSYLALGFNSSGLRALRIIRVLRFARFGMFSVALETILEVFRSRAYELAVSLMMTIGLLIAASTLMFLAEGSAQPETFGSIPRALWWSVVTMTTVGYGDAYPITPMGKALAGVVALTSIAIVAVPTGILASSFSEAMQKRKAPRPPSQPPDSSSFD